MAEIALLLLIEYDMNNSFNIIKRISIRKLWSNKDLQLNVKSDINFLIGVNGSGKTTVINLVAATLNVDLYTLMHIEFESIVIELTNSSSFTTIVTVDNLKYSNDSQPKIKFTIENSSEPPNVTVWDFEYIEDRYRYHGHAWIRNTYRIPRFVPSTIQDTMSQIVKLRWLPVNRSGRDYGAYEEQTYRHSVEERIENQSRQLAELFSYLDSSEKEILSEFQRKIFISLIQTTPSHEKIYRQLSSINLKTEREALDDIFQQFRVQKHGYISSLSKSFSRLEELQQKVREKDSILSNEDYSIILQLQSFHSVVDEWNNYLKKKKELYQPKNNFVNIFNRMVTEKEMIINDRNRIEFKTDSGKILQAEQLSSGEKQLLILLSETLLQSESTWIYIADEPELSLHVDWQQKLVTNLRSLNAGVQIIFATHSPDIVGRYQKKVFKMQELIK